LEIDGAKRDYDWGSRSAIEDMLGLPRDGRPLAELWFGAHPEDPAPVPALGTTLDAVIAADPAAMLGEATARRFGQLPFLLKVLAAERPLSIQVHPTLAQARAGFAAQDAAGVPRQAANRSYRDANHKPELLCALTAFEALCGFRTVDDLRAVLRRFALPELHPVAELVSVGLRAPFEHLLRLADPAPLVAAVTARAGELAAIDAEDGAARAVLLAAEHFPGDVGVVLSLLLNYVALQPGEAIYLGAGNVHAYLRGLGVEIMATSDNVLRCGLTSKYVDVAELLKISDFRSLERVRWPATSTEGWARFDVPVPDFRLSRIELDGRATHRDDGPCIVLCASGRVTVAADAGGERVSLGPGHAAFVPASSPQLGLTGAGTVFVAGVGRLD
jgi:mannose-6-phosphate isomerase